MKAAGPQTAFEVELYPLLARTVPERALIAARRRHDSGWVLLPDGGPTLGTDFEDAELVEPFVDALVHYARLQRTLAPHVGDLLALGVADMRPQVMPERFEQALEAAAPYVDQHGDPEAHAAFARVGRLPDAVATWCAQLEDSRPPPSLDHNDLHPWNVLEGARFYDWGDSVVAHPFAAMLVPLGFVQRLLDVDLDNAQYVRARDAYLDVFADDAPGEASPRRSRSRAPSPRSPAPSPGIGRCALPATRAGGRGGLGVRAFVSLSSLLDDTYVGRT